MKYLIDTNIFLWFALDDPRLPLNMKTIIEEEANDIFVSVVSLWELTIKHSLGKLELTRPLHELFLSFSDEFHFSLLAIEKAHLLKLDQLPFHHRDPFDRLIFAQSLVETMPLLSSDKMFDNYRT